MLGTSRTKVYTVYTRRDVHHTYRPCAGAASTCNVISSAKLDNTPGTLRGKPLWKKTKQKIQRTHITWTFADIEEHTHNIIKITRDTVYVYTWGGGDASDNVLRDINWIASGCDWLHIEARVTHLLFYRYIHEWERKKNIKTMKKNDFSGNKNWNCVLYRQEYKREIHVTCQIILNTQFLCNRVV